MYQGFFYRRKLNVYNLTAQTNIKQVYCAFWPKVVSGRAGNDIASSFISILEKAVEDHPATKHLICWSNSHISHAIQEFLDKGFIESTTWNIRQQPFRIIQMTERHFNDYANSAKLSHCDKVPYQRVALHFRSDS